jgi:NAD(P)H-hydrate epimerase
VKILSAAQMREVDRLTSDQRGITSLTLMENAGAAVAGFCARQFPHLASRRIVVLCGKGYNGGDALVAARHLRDMGARPEVWLLAKAEEVRGDAAINRDRWLASGGELRMVSSAEEWKRPRAELVSAQIVVDGIFGTGFRGPVEGWLTEVIDDVNASRPGASVVAIDMPSGLPSDTGAANGSVIRADYTVTFTAPKRGQLMGRAADYVGLLRVAEIGSPAELVDSVAGTSDATTPAWRWLEVREFATLPMQRPPDSNKGKYGHVLVVAGSRGKSGAAVLSGTAALRAGAGLVTVATAECTQPIVAGALPELMTAPLACSEGGSISLACLQQFKELAKGKSVVAMGPGLGTDPETQEVVRGIVRECALPMVLDADGLNAFDGRAEDLRDHGGPFLAVTPHPGEMARLAECSIAEVQSNRIEMATRHAAKWNAWVALKGYHTVIAAPDGRVWINSTGNPGMATAGTGDVLTGMMAGMLAEFSVEAGMKLKAQALNFAVYLHGLAGDLAAEETGEAPLIVSDLIRAIPRAWRQVRTELEIG